MNLIVDIHKEIYNDCDFHIYAGMIKETYEDVTVKTNGFELCNGPKKLVGSMGTYKGQKSFICQYEEFDGQSKEAQKNLLMSINGIKESKAELIIRNVDDINIFRKDDYPRIKGIGPGTVLLIREGLQLLDTMKIFKEMNILLGNSCTPKVIKEITEIVETLDGGMDTFKDKPWMVLIDHAGMGFMKADKIALKMGAKIDNIERQCYLIEYVVKQYTRTGNCYITLDKLKETLEEQRIKYDEDSIINNHRLVIDDERIYTCSMFESETLIPRMLHEFEEKETDIKLLDTYEVEEYIKDFEKLNKIKFDEYQREAVETAVNKPVSIITGGAGSGKTTLLKCVNFILETINYRLFLTAPTGKAARRMSQACGYEATTIHRFLNDSMDLRTYKNSVMIVDESSMIDTELFFELLSAMDRISVDFKKIILVGDPGQLPSVQPGNVLNDLITSEKLPTIKLTKTFRQAGDSNIIDIATNVRHNETFDFMKKKDFYVKEIINAKEYKESIKYFFSYLRDKYNDLDTFYSEVQFITPIKKGDIGVNEINTMIKNEINPKQDKKNWFPFDLNDKVMCIKNDRENGIFNGEFGRIHYVDNTTFTIYYRDLEKYVTYKKEFDIVQDFILSYCSTVHKLQGSEFKFVVIILAQDSFICDSRLLYTAITRGKETVIMLTNKSITDKIIPRNNLLKRNTHLKERIEAEYGE
jgi:exodeoxyribonuclease V alpha subunit